MRRPEQGLLTLLCAVCVFTSTMKAGEVFDGSSNTAEQSTVQDSTPDSSKTTGSAFVKVGSSRAFFFNSLLEPPDPMTGGQRFDYYLGCTFGVNAIVRTSVVAGIQHARNTVPEWGQGLEGYGTQFASSIGRRIIKNTIHHGLASLLHEDPRYYPSGRTGIWNRSVYAASQTFITHKNRGNARFAYSYMLGNFGSIYLSREWYPEGRRTVDEYLLSTATSLGFDAAKNIFHEFWPDIKSRFRH